MKLRKILVLILLGLLSSAQGTLLFAAPPGAAQQVLRDLKTISPAEHIKHLSSLQSRFTGYPGSREAESYVLAQYKALGLVNITREPFQLIVPVDKGAHLRVGQQQIPIYCVMPNYVRTPKTPETGLTGELIWGGEDLGNFNGKQVMGNIALMEFNSAARWLEAAKLGASAIIFIEPSNAFRFDAEQKYSSIPIPVPRYYIERKDLPALAAAAAGKQVEDDPKAALDVIKRLGSELKAPATILADMAWQEETVYAISGEIPGIDPEMGEQVVVCHAYYDSVSVVPALSPGAESACGIAAQLEIAQFLARHPPRRTVKFLATPGHFQALAGARHYAFKTIYPRRKEETLNAATEQAGEPFFFIALDLSSRQNSMAGFYKGSFYDQYGKADEIKIQRILSDYSSLLQEWAEDVLGPEGAISGLQFQSGIVPQHGREWRSLLPDLAAFDSEVITLSGRPAITLATTGDPRNSVNTPLDTYENVEPYLENVRNQAMLCAYLVKQTADQPIIPMNGKLETAKVGSIFGRAIEQSLSDYVPTVNVPDAVVSVKLSDAKSMLGVSGRAFVRSDVQGLFEVFGLDMSKSFVFDGFILTPTTGAVEAVSKPKPEVLAPSLRQREEWELRLTDLRLNFFQCVSTTLFDQVDPLRLRLVSQLTVLRAEANSDIPDQYRLLFVGTDLAGTSYGEPAAVVYTKPDQRLKFITAIGPTLNSGMILNIEVPLDKKQQTAKQDKAEEIFQGVGIMADKPESFVYLTSYQIARDMHLLDYYRLFTLEKSAIRKKNVWDLHGEAYTHLTAAQEKLRQKKYDEFYREVQLAWAFESRIYPDVRGTAHDVVRGVVFYFALLLPFVIFAERLLTNYVDIRAKLVATGVVFVASYAVLMLVHPAFRLSKAPIIILDGFFMLVASFWTIWYLIAKFQSVMEKVKQKIQTIHRADVARTSAAMAAFILGISNMRKRKVRTLLTALTLILLTFTVLSFTSFETMPARILRYESSEKAPYTGVLIRNVTWSPLSESEANGVCNYFETEGMPVAPRSWFVNREMTEELKLEVSRADGPGTAVANATLGLSQKESDFSRIADYLSNGSWFDSKAKDWPFLCIVPTGMMESLRLEAGDIGQAFVSVMGRRLRVVGSLDSRRFLTYEDLDQEPLTPVDFVQQQFKEAGAKGAGPAFTATGEMKAEDFASRKTEEKGLYIHMDPDRVLVVPNELCMALGGTLRSIPAGPGVAGSEALLRSFQHSLMQFASRVNLPLYAGLDGHLNRIATRSRLSMGGLQGLLIPILIAALIVFNTMLGAVYERVSEIKTYASVGLAPIHITALFFAESSVFAVVGAMLGYLLGQVISFGLMRVPSLMEGISLNYSSISAVWSALLIMLVVLASTAYPARMAGKLSVPDETRRMVLPKPTSDVWEIMFPFTVSSKEALGVMTYLREYFESNDEDSIGKFTADNLKFYRKQADAHSRVVLDADVWVAPLDMGISQSVSIAAVPDAEEPDITYLFFTITRKSGEFATWHRMNLGFLKDLRRQLLIWRLVTSQEKQRLAEEGELILQRLAPQQA